jgi:hemin uptake protein HemP
MRSKNTPASTATTGTGAAYADRLHSQALFQGRQEICIEHADQLYRLRITRQGKLILTK